MRFCENCGNELIPNARFCDNCGAPVPVRADASGAAKDNAPEENNTAGGVPENGLEENLPEGETGITQGTFSYGRTSNAGNAENAGSTENTEGAVPKRSVPGTGDDGPHEYHYDQNSPYSCGTAGKTKKDGIVIKIAIIVIIVVVVIIVLLFLGINRAKNRLEEMVETYNNTPVSEEITEKEPAEETPKVSAAEEEPEEEGSYLDGLWYGQYTVQAAGTDEAEAYFDEWYDAYAYIGEDSGGRKFFEVYDDIESDDPPAILSMYIEETEDGFRGVFGDEDAWLYDKYLTSEEEYLYDIKIDEEDTIYLACPYHDDEEGYDYVVLMYFER